MKIWWSLDLFRYYLHDEYDEISHLGAIKLTEAEWKDYQRVEAEHQAWQERIESLAHPGQSESGCSAAARLHPNGAKILRFLIESCGPFL